MPRKKKKTLSDEEIQKIYDMICKYHKKIPEEERPKLPKLRDNNGKYTKNALVLVYLARGYPRTEVVSKKKLTEFVREYDPDVSDVQQAKHLGKQSGWYIISGTRKEVFDIKIPSGSYQLVSLEKPHPSFIKDRRSGVSTDDFDIIKKKYGYRCAVCGSKEGEPHLIRRGEITTLQKGHMDPNKDLVKGNIIPQCQICNRPDRNRWIYDATGRVIHVANTEDGRRVVEHFIDKADIKTRKYLLKYIEKKLKK